MIIVKAGGRDAEEATRVPAPMLAATLGNAVSSSFESLGRSSKGGRDLRGAPFGAQAYRERMRSARADGAGREPPPAHDLTGGAGPVLEGELSLLVFANSATDIAAICAARRSARRRTANGCAARGRMARAGSRRRPTT